MSPSFTSCLYHFQIVSFGNKYALSLFNLAADAGLVQYGLIEILGTILADAGPQAEQHLPMLVLNALFVQLLVAGSYLSATSSNSSSIR